MSFYYSDENPGQKEIFYSGVSSWNAWRRAKPDVIPDLTGFDLRVGNPIRQGRRFTDKRELDLSQIDLSNAILNGVTLSGVNLRKANLSHTQLRGADLSGATLIETNLEGADLTGCKVFGISAWKINLKDATQQDLIISDVDEPLVTVDNLEVAQFVYLMLYNEKIRNVIDTITSKAVLILGRFTPDRKLILDAIREALRKRNYLPILFDFEKPTNRDFTETIITLAGLSKFIIADLSEPKSSPYESSATIQNFRIPFLPIIQEGEDPFSMFVDLKNKYDWVMDPISYKDKTDLLNNFENGIIRRAEEKYREIQVLKLRDMEKPMPISKFK